MAKVAKPVKRPRSRAELIKWVGSREDVEWLEETVTYPTSGFATKEVRDFEESGPSPSWWTYLSRQWELMT